MTLEATRCNRGSPLAALFTRNGATPKCPLHGEACEEFHRLKELAKRGRVLAEALDAAAEREEWGDDYEAAVKEALEVYHA